MKKPGTIKIYQAPIRLFVLIGATIFVAHTLDMVLFAILPHFHMWAGSIIQSVLLLILLFPVLYYFSFRPLLLHIAEREQAEAAMRESEGKYRNLFEHLGNAAFLVDVQTGRILDTNGQGESLLGRSRGEIMGLNHSQLYPSAREQEGRSFFAANARQEHPGNLTTEIVHKDLAPIPAIISAVPATLHDRRMLILLVRPLPQ